MRRNKNVIVFMATGMMELTLGDDPLDQLNIKLGIDYYKKIHKKPGEKCE